MAGLFVVLGILAGISIIWVVRMKQVVLKIWSMTPLERYRRLNVILESYGLYYEEQQDVFLNRCDCVKGDRKVKKGKGKKEGVVASFSYGQQKYHLCMNQRQKGMFMQLQIHFFLESSSNRCYPVKNEQCLDMALVLYEEGKRSMVLGKKGWQLLVLKPCCLCGSECRKLRMRIIFPDSNMALAFVKGMREAGYRFMGLSRNCTWVILDILSPPDTAQEKVSLSKKLSRLIGRAWIRCYCEITKPFYKTVDRMLFFHEMLPFLFPLLFFGRKCN